MDELLNELARSNIGCYIGSRHYADIMLHICEEFAHEYGLKYKYTKLIVIRS